VSREDLNGDEIYALLMRIDDALSGDEVNKVSELISAWPITTANTTKLTAAVAVRCANIMESEAQRIHPGDLDGRWHIGLADAEGIPFEPDPTRLPLPVRASLHAGRMVTSALNNDLDTFHALTMVASLSIREWLNAPEDEDENPFVTSFGFAVLGELLSMLRVLHLDARA
jgi:hypothetical protein